MANEFLTEPALRTTDKAGREGFPVLRLTIAFHPDLDRIGQWTDLCLWDPERPDRLPGEYALGRYSPEFADGKPIADAHVSRLAVLLRPKKQMMNI